MELLLNLLPQLLRGAGDSDEAREHALIAAWAAVAGAQLRRVTAAVRLERKTLIVATTDRLWRDQLQDMTSHMLFRLNSLLGSPVVTSIEFVVNERLVPKARQAQPAVAFIAPEKQAQPLLEKAAAIADEQLRATFLRAAGKCLERRG